MKKIVTGIICLVLVASFVVSPVKASAMTTNTSNEAQIQVLLKLLALLQQMLVELQRGNAGTSVGTGVTNQNDDSEVLYVSSGELFQSATAGDRAYLRVHGKNLEDIYKLEYSANCCKPTTGYLENIITKTGSYLDFGLDTYLGNVTINGLSVRVVATDGSVSNWISISDSDGDSSIGTPAIDDIALYPLYFEKNAVSDIVLGKKYTVVWEESDTQDPVYVYLEKLSGSQWVKESTLATVDPVGDGSNSATISLPTDLQDSDSKYQLYVETIGSGGRYSIDIIF